MVERCHVEVNLFINSQYYCYIITNYDTDMCILNGVLSKYDHYFVKRKTNIFNCRNKDLKM